MKRKAERTERNGGKFAAVMTPPAAVEQMLDMLSPDTWINPNIRLIEPSVGTGNFIDGELRRLMVGLAKWEPDPVKRRRYIFDRIIYAIDIQPIMIASCVKRFGLSGQPHNFRCGDFLEIDVRAWIAIKDGPDESAAEAA